MSFHAGIVIISCSLSEQMVSPPKRHPGSDSAEAARACPRQKLGAMHGSERDEGRSYGRGNDVLNRFIMI